MATLSEEELTQLKEDATKHLWVHTAQGDDIADPDRIMVKGEGFRVTDINGDTYLDPMGGLELVNVGYGRTEIADAVHAQMVELQYINTFSNQTVPQIKLAARVAELLPGTLSKVFFVTSGSEAVEAALKIVRQYQALAGFPHRYKTIARRGSYHGSTMGPVSIQGPLQVIAASPDVEPLPTGGLQVPPPTCYRCPFGLRYPDCNIQCAREIKQVIEFEGPETVAAVVVDPVSAQHGAPPAEYMPMVREICDEFGVLLHCDEVINGFGRTGKWFASEHWDVVPDVITLSKGMCSGYIPIGAAVATAEVAEKFSGDRRNTLRHGQTWGGHPVACAAALKNIEIIEREDLVQNAETVGAYMQESLHSLKEDHPMVGNVSGLGMMAVVDLVSDRETKRRLEPSDMRQLGINWRKEGLIGSPTLFTPPLTVTKGDIDEVINRLDRAYASTEKEMGLL
jgi:adenosylmethionine-8-amino-7-oxononanoate aminotransferase